MKLQQQVLAHMRAKFPDVTFEDGPRTKDQTFDVAADCEIAWEKNDPAITAEFERYMALQQFCSGLESLTRATGVVIVGQGDWPVVRKADPNELSDRHHYRLEEWGQVQWRQDLDS
jgi:hypothetical protein